KINQLQSFVMLFLKAFHIIWSIGLIIFGLHLMIVGYLTFKSDNVPKLISILLLIASISYIIIHFNYTFLPQLNGVNIHFIPIQIPQCFSNSSGITYILLWENVLNFLHISPRGVFI